MKKQVQGEKQHKLKATSMDTKMYVGNTLLEKTMLNKYILLPSPIPQAT